MLTLKHKWLLSLVMMGAVLILGFFFPRPHDEAYYTKIVTATLLPEETRNGSGAAPKDSPPKPYWRFTLPMGYLSNDSLQAVGLEFDALYPTMEHFVPPKKAIWFKLNPKGKLGPPVDDVLRIFTEFYIHGDNDGGSQIVRSYEADLGKWKVLADPPAELTAKMPNLRMFRWMSDQNKLYDRGRDTLVYQQPDGRQVVVSGFYKSYWVDTTWSQKIRIRYLIPESRILEAPEIDLAVQHLIDSFNPTFFQ